MFFQLLISFCLFFSQQKYQISFVLLRMATLAWNTKTNASAEDQLKLSIFYQSNNDNEMDDKKKQKNIFGVLIVHFNICRLLIKNEYQHIRHTWHVNNVKLSDLWFTGELFFNKINGFIYHRKMWTIHEFGNGDAINRTENANDIQKNVQKCERKAQKKNIYFCSAHTFTT